MTNTWNEHEALDGGNREKGVITQVEFRIFQREIQQVLQAIQTTLAKEITRNVKVRWVAKISEKGLILLVNAIRFHVGS
jgi:hypothetical protein